MLKEHEQQVVQERDALHEKQKKLAAFLDAPNLKDVVTDEWDRTILCIQLHTMTMYLNVLDKRVERIEE